MPDPEGKTSGEGIKDTPDQAYKSGRPEDVEPGSLGAAPEPEDTPAGEVGNPRAEGEEGSYQSGGFTGDEKGGPMDASGEGDASATQTPTQSGEGAEGSKQKDGMSGQTSEGDDGLGSRTEADDPDERGEHPKTPSHMGR
jgi:hypothetical protein